MRYVKDLEKTDVNKMKYALLLHFIFFDDQFRKMQYMHCTIFCSKIEMYQLLST